MSTLFDHYVERIKKQQTLEVKGQTDTSLTYHRKGPHEIPQIITCEWDHEKTDLIHLHSGVEVCVVHTTDEDETLETYSMLQWVKSQLIAVHFQLYEEEMARFIRKVSKNGLFYPFMNLDLKDAVAQSGDCLEEILSELPRYRLLTYTGTLTIINH